MPNKPSAIKRVRKSERQNLRNRTWKSKIHTTSKKVEAAISEGDKDKAQAALTDFAKVIDAAAGKGVVHANRAARRKSSLSTQINAIES